MRVLIQRVIKTEHHQRMFAKGWFYDVVKMKFPFDICNSKRLFERNINGRCCTHILSTYYGARISGKKSGNIFRLIS